MKTLSLAIALGFSVIFSTNSFSMNELPKQPQGKTEIVKDFGSVLTGFFGHELALDSTLRSSCLKFVEEQVEGNEVIRDKKYAYFHQMWTLTDPIENYKTESITNSFDKMIKQDVYKNYFSRMEGESYWVEVVKKGDKYYLVVAIN